ncbi:MAG: endoribonuclease YicC domain-containing protein [Planctomycetota bacterium]
MLVQDLRRETNTIGSKAHDATIAHDVVSIKTLIEQLREMVQNVE